MLSPGINSKPVANRIMRVRWSGPKLNNGANGNGSRMKLTEFSATARFEFNSVSKFGGEVVLGVIAKFAGETLKKILPAASTLIRAEEVGVFGTVTVAAPLFAVLETSTNGKLLPPSIESNTRTFAQSMGALEVFATFQLTV